MLYRTVHSLLRGFTVIALLTCLVINAASPSANKDPCVAIGGKKWVAPADVRACFRSFPVNNTLRNNVLDVVSKTFNFQTSINYQIQAPPPFFQDVHVDIVAELTRIRAQSYASEFDFHVDLSQTIKRLQDGHTVYQDFCYDSAFLTYLPFPVVALTQNGKQHIHIAPEAFNVSSAEFADEIDEWQRISHLNFSEFSGATVLAINEQDPWIAVDTNAQTTGSFQAHTTRQNKFFSSYIIGWTYRMGDFAQQTLPLTDSAQLTVLRAGHTLPETILVPYRSRIGSTTIAFTDGPSYRVGNCVAVSSTNGVDDNGPTVLVQTPTTRFMPPVSPADRRQPLNALVNEAPLTDIALPPGLIPSSPVSGSPGLQFFELDDGKTGVLALASFQTGSFDTMESELLAGLQQLKDDGRTRLLVDLTNNGGGFICIAHWLHRIIVGPNPDSVPQAGLDTKARDQDIAQLIVQKIVEGADPSNNLLYNGANWNSANGTNFGTQTDWLQPPVDLTINGHPDMFSQRLGQECQPFDMTPPSEQIFAPENIVLMNNGACASSCALFTIAMSKHYNVTTVVVGGKEGTIQQYTGTVGGQSSNFVTMDTEVKSVGLKDHPQAPRDFLTNSAQGITWRLGFGINDPTQPEEWQEHFATINFPVSIDIVNNPVALWNAIVKRVFGS